jgi:hypothetical protein
VNNKIPKELTNRQELQRQKTINDVLRAIATMKAEGYCLKIKNLIEFTGLSRSVFGKSHIRKVLIDNGIVDAKPDVAWAFQSSAKLSKEQKLRLKLKEKDEHIKRITDENICLKSECELLRGKLFLLMQKQSFE